MRGFLKVLTILFLFAFLFGSCSDLGMFSPSVEESAGIKVLSRSEGKFLEKGESVDYLIQTEETGSEPVLLEIDIALPSGESVWNTSISSPLTNVELELPLPELETGQYNTRFIVQGEEGVIEEEQISFFYVSGTYDIQGISSYPPTIMAGHETVIQAELLHPEGSNPYIRWTQEEKLLARGSLSEGYDSISWPAPKKEGVYSIQVELFPVPPPGDADFPFASSVALMARLYVSADSYLSEDELFPENSYYSLFHLNGSLENSGTSAETAEENSARLSGGARLTSEAGVMGYDLAKNGAIIYSENILPIVDGRLSPCTLTLELIPRDKNLDKSLVTIMSGDEALQFRLFFNEDGQIAATMEHGKTLLFLPSGIIWLEEQTLHRIDLSLIPDESSLQAIWFLDGQQTAYNNEDPLPADLPADGETIIAGEEGIAAIVTEIGVYYRDERNRPSIDPDIYRDTTGKKYGTRLVLAEGFDGLYLPENWEKRRGDITLHAGSLVMEPSSEIYLPFFELGDGKTTFDVEFFGDIPPGSRVVMQWEGSEEPFFTVDPTGTVIPSGETESEAAFAALQSSLKLTFSTEYLSLLTAADPLVYPLSKPAAPDNWLTAILQSPPAQGVLKIDSLLIVQNPGQ